jgi:hypothetical protein
MPQVRNYLPIALKDANMRRSACAVEAIFRSANILDELPPECLEEIKDYCNAWNKDRKGAFSDFKHAYIAMVSERLADAKLTERRLYYGITGRPDTKTMKDYELQRRDPDTRPDPDGDETFEG